ncbi:MAG TPA: radical SAM protein [Clostridia bacterium]|nr:radical SAM protein [Clostridia bacterium]
MKTIPAKTLVSRTKYPDYWFGNDYNMNIYRGCNQGCIYCDSRSLCYGNPDFDHVAIKNNALGILEKELAGKRKKGVVGTGSMSDPYNSYEASEQASRNALEILKKYGFGVGICTKNTMVCRDIDLLQGISASSPVTVCITITAADDSISGKIEPGAPSSKERFKAISELSEAGIYCGVLMMPLLTGITDTGENIRGLVEMAKESGADFIYPAFGFTMRDGSREYLYRKLDELFPGLREEYTERYGASYRCDVPDARKLSGLFEKLCEGYKIVYKMNDIIEMSADRVRNRQMTLF